MKTEEEIRKWFEEFKKWLEEQAEKVFESWQVDMDGYAFTQGYQEAIRRVIEKLKK